MTVEEVIFYIFSGIALLGASMVIFSKNPVKAVLFLVLTFFATAGLWMLLAAEFLSVILVLVYVGAVMVLFLFVVMMLDIESASMGAGFARFLPLGLIIAALTVGSLIYAISAKNFVIKTVSLPLSHPINVNNGKILGELLFTEFLYPFELAGILLFVAIIAAISLIRHNRLQNKALNPDKQIKVRKEERLQLVNMKSEKQKI